MEKLISKFIYLKHKTNLKCVAVILGKKESNQLMEEINNLTMFNGEMNHNYDQIDGTEIIYSDKESFFGIVVSD